MTREEKSCISDLKKIITKVAADLIKEAAKDEIYLSFSANKFDDLFLFYKDIKYSVKDLVSTSNFLINKFKISSIISLSLCNKYLISGKNKKQTEYFNFYLSLLVSERFILQFLDKKSDNKFDRFRKDCTKPTLQIIKVNSSLINNNEIYKNKHIVLACVYNLAYQYDLLHKASIKIK